jgi:nicotinamide riboside kinase
MSKTLYVDLFAGPGTSKSTTATYVFSALKSLGKNVEYVSEYAKDKTWTEDFQTLKIQSYVTGKQFYRALRLDKKVEVVISDSSFLLGALYPGVGSDEYWLKHLLYQYSLLRTLPFFLQRNTTVHPYNPKGRNQTEAESIELDNKILSFLKDNNINFTTVEVQKAVAQFDENSNLVGFTNPTGNFIVSQILKEIS